VQVHSIEHIAHNNNSLEWPIGQNIQWGKNFSTKGFISYLAEDLFVFKYQIPNKN
jgi:hypothetical protein